MGYLEIENGKLVERKLVEMDYFDIFLNHGFIGTIIILGILISLLIVAIKNIFSNIKNVITDPYLIFSCYSVVIALFIALIAGHVLTAPAVSFFFVIAMMEILKKDFEQ